MKKLIAFCLISLLLTGCGTTAKFVYPSNRKNLVQLCEKPKYNLSVAVLPFEEERLDRNSFAGFYLYLIPLVPYGIIKYERPDAARMFNTIGEFQFDVSEDVAKAVVTSLRHSNLFKDVFFTFGGEKKNADLIITGNVLSTFYEGKTYSYGLSIYGPLLWFVGLPAGSSYNKLSLKISLNKAEAEEPIWEYSFAKDKRIIQGLYYKWGYDVKSYTTLMEEGMNEAIKDLDRKLSRLKLEQ